MSRWVDQFNAHPFNLQWTRVKNAIDAAKIDDETVITNVQELARLRKVVKYLDVMISGVDPELVPLGAWDNFNSQADACATQIESYNSNRNAGHIQSANNHADNLLTYLRPYMVGEVVAKDAAKSSLDSYFDTFTGYIESFKEKSTALLAEINGNKTKTQEITNAINNFNADVEQLKIELFDPDSGVKNKINGMAAEVVSQHTKISGLYNEVVVGSDDKPSTKLVVQQARELIESEKEKAIYVVESAEAEVSEIKKFHTKVFGDKTEQGDKLGGMALAFDDFMKELATFEAAQKTRYTALNKEIEDLLPGATSAGLATAYKDMRGSFSRSILISNITFYVSLLLLFFSALSSAVDSFTLWPFGIVFAHVGEWDAILKGVAHRIPLYIPVLWLALYASKRRSEFQRLQQEYAHKEALAKSYNNFKKQIDDLGQEDTVLITKLIDKAIDAIAYNASETLDGKHGEKMPIQEVVEKALEAVIKPKDELISTAKKIGG